MTWAPERRTPLQVLRALESGPRGLLESEADARLARDGENVLPTRRTPSWPLRLVRSLRDPFTAVLASLAVVSALVAAWGTAAVIAVLVAVSCVLRAAGEYRADRSAAGLRELVATTATVVRRSGPDADPAPREIPVDQVVVGDVVRLGPGDLVPADLRLLRATGLTMHQAALTGESAPVRKHPADEPSPAGTGFDAPELCFQGSSVASGSGTGVVVATGADTRFAAAYGGDGAVHRAVHGEGARGKVRGGDRRTTAFDRSVYGISWILIRFMLLTPPLVLMANAALRGRGLETLPFAVAVAVGLTPEMLPVIVTTALARGAATLARTHEVIVKRLPALHDLGAVDVVCVDKTGTLTQDRPVLDCALDASGAEDPDVLRWAAANSLWTLQLAEVPAADALDEALLDAAEQRLPGGLDALEHDPVAALPFDPVRRLSTAVVRTPDRLGSHTLIVKGAVEEVLDRCALGAGERSRITALAAARADDGLRVLAVALGERPARTRAYTTADERGLTFVGLVGLRDATAETAAAALTALARSGVEVKVLTGDHPGTAARACRELGLAPGDVVTADVFDGLPDAALAELAARTTVFARCTPEQKARIVRVLRERGHVTGFLGDGVNDLPALRASDVGICPRDAVDVAREAADVVLAAKDLTSLDHAIMAGRRAGGTIAGYLRITLSSNFGNVIAMLTAGLLLPFLPMLPAQVLVQNLCFDAAQLAFAYDRQDPAALRRPLRLRPREVLRFVTGFGLLNAAADLATFAVLAWAVRAGSDASGQASFHTGWFTENLLTQALAMLLLRAERGVRGPVPVAACGLAGAGVLLPLTPVGAALGMAPLPGVYYPLVGVVLGLYAGGLWWCGRGHR
ncbi:magnesium-translocating P-type ATPase [Streptomyces melanogenes]|uniref:magnesium-translocating P-type ATPase n=1 Tax=Streptomyces melanogenes TaxID=67326 RepID=UPI00167D0562|nr:magnesium-translocating P-type ATPase [Streptomyces melanogenes]GGP79206.1 magnesium-translocating P-type ATPase [Streptomyces melanogenes]